MIALFFQQKAANQHQPAAEERSEGGAGDDTDPHRGGPQIADPGCHCSYHEDAQEVDAPATVGRGPEPVVAPVQAESTEREGELVGSKEKRIEIN